MTSYQQYSAICDFLRSFSALSCSLYRCVYCFSVFVLFVPTGIIIMILEFQECGGGSRKFLTELLPFDDRESCKTVASNSVTLA